MSIFSVNTSKLEPLTNISTINANAKSNHKSMSEPEGDGEENPVDDVNNIEDSKTKIVDTPNKDTSIDLPKP